MGMMDATDLYLGTWRLVPELSLYEAGSPPASGTYVIAAAGAEARLEVHWRMAVGEPEQSTAFGGPVDGTPVALPVGAAGSAGPDAFTLTRVDARTLDSAALRGGEVVAFARRVAAADGSLLAVVQEGPKPGGGRFRNFQVYRREGG